MKVIKISEKVVPLYSDVLISLRSDVIESTSGIILPDELKQSMTSDVQKVMATGPQAQQVKVGDEVKLKMVNLMTLDTKWIKGKTSNENDDVQSKGLILDPTKIHTIDGKKYMLIREGDIAYKVLTVEKK